jgi:LytS/YehU family sensor histidine kinase
MISALRWLWPPAAPSLRELPAAILRAVLFGVVAALPLSLLFTPIRTWDRLLAEPLNWMLQASGISVTFAVCFYLFCGLPLSYVAKHVHGSRQEGGRRVLWMVGLFGAALGTVAALLVFAVSNRSVSDEHARVAVGAGIFAMALSIALNAWHTARAEQALAEARARNQVLRAQINPHFFFNTLNTIAALIPSDPSSAERTINLLADMSRYAFSASGIDLTRLSDELAFARTYLEIEKARFGDRLQFTFPSEQDAAGLALPALTIQPVVENAVRHGTCRRMEGGTIAVGIVRSADQFSVTVESPCESSDSDFFRPGHALSNIRERLRLTYGAKGAVEITRPTPDSVAVTIRAPIES